MLEIREILYAELETSDGFQDLINEYTTEAATQVTPNAKPDSERYRLMTELGAIRMIGAFDGDKVVGLAGVVVAKTQMHSTAPICSIESFYLRKNWRKGPAGLQLLNGAKAIAKDAGAPGLLITTPKDSIFNALLGALGMSHIQNVWWCDL